MVAAIFGELDWLTRLVYIVVGLSALWQLVPLSAAFGIGEPAAEAGRRRVGNT